MKKLILTLCFCLIASTAFAADTWTYIVKEVTKPQLTKIQIAFVIRLNGEDQATEYVGIDPAELDGMTAAQRRTYAATKIKAQIAPYIKAHLNVQGLETVINQEFSAQ